jgi:DNA-binding CsgD family transcriptional regulator
MAQNKVDLTLREYQIIKLSLEGRNENEIVDLLSMKKPVLYHYQQRILSKMGFDENLPFAVFLIEQYGSRYMNTLL